MNSFILITLLSGIPDINYFPSDLSIRKIAHETNISWVSIYNTLKLAKEELRETFKEDWEDYKNNDYELLK